MCKGEMILENMKDKEKNDFIETLEVGEEEQNQKEEKSQTENSVNDLEDKIKEIEDKYNELSDKYLRCLAEYDNFRKRTSKEKERIYTDAIGNSVKGILDVLDNFERALNCKTEDVEMKKGFEMIFNQLLESIKKLGVEEIKSDGEIFNPALHNAVMHIEDEKYEANYIVETLQKGYKIKDNIIRYAMVKVAN